ncbi:TrbI/VirB10 family protein [Gloeobacter violaceus]|uniref:Glr2037 protein n=1 Tax=Gloeobacter violaceus (strain ATCC 29082 / PCC 7421) TaxID=251221 RepID=Q7NIZ5_GLOVI|nr:TrbI/VirB10 family protein [Gloeobacter violaceus]BAC89978.1 glr2037 [Gloeobacter violaceus PCC 7421]
MTQPEFDQFDQQPDRRERLLRWLTPGRKVAIVGGLTLLPALGIGAALNGLFYPSAPRPKAEAAAKPAAAVPRATQPAPTDEVDRLKAEVALADQRQMLEQLRSQQKDKPSPPPATKLRGAKSLPPARLLSPPALAQSATWRPDTNGVRVLPPPAALGALAASGTGPAQLAFLGSSREQEGARGGTPPPTASAPDVALPPVARRTAIPRPAPAISAATSLDPSLEPLAAQGSPVHHLSATHRLPAGAAIPAASLAAGVLERPILWEQEQKHSPAASEADRHVVVLTEPLAGPEGDSLLPAGTRVLAALRRVSPGGLVTLEAVALRADRREIPLQSVAVRAVGGLPLVAVRQDKGGEIGGLDTGQSLLKGAEEGLAILNRASSTIEASGFGGATTSANYGQANALAAFGSGLFGELGRLIRQRNQQAVRQVIERPDLWLIPGGTAVELLFGREVPL